MKKIKIHFTAVFNTTDNLSITKDILCNQNDFKDFEAEVMVNFAEAKGYRVITFRSIGYFSDCAATTRIFLINMMQSMHMHDIRTYNAVHDLLFPFIKIMSEEIQYQSIHRTVRDEICARAGLEIEELNDMRMNDAIRVLERNDHYGNYFRQCPCCREFEIPESKKLGKHIRRCPCCGLKLIEWD